MLNQNQFFKNKFKNKIFDTLLISQIELKILKKNKKNITNIEKNIKIFVKK